MELYALAAVVLIAVYGLFSAYASSQHFKGGQIEPWAAVGMFAAALALLGAGFLLGDFSPFTLPLLIAALLSLHALAIVNGRYMHGKVNWRHHIGRGILSLVLTTLTYLALS